MVVTTTKQALSVNRIIGQKTDTDVIEEDFIVPDIKPDILNTISTSGVVCVYKKEVLSGKVRIDGAINTYIMYLADDEKSSVRGLNTILDFSKTIDMENVKEGMTLENKITLKSIECRVLNGRKISIKAIIEIELKVLSNEEIEFVNEVEDVKDVQLLNKTLTLNSILGTGLTRVYAKDTMVIDSADNLAEIMKAEISIINKETKVSYNKILVKADSLVKIMYLTEDNRINIVSQQIPVMGFIDMQDVTDENVCDVSFELKNLLIKPNSVEEHSIYVEAELEIDCSVSQEKQMNIIQDLYSPSVDLVYKQKQINVISKKEVAKDICTIREKQLIPEIGNHKIYDVDVMPSIISQKILNGRIMYEGQIKLNFIFEEDNSSRVNTLSIEVPFTFNMDFEGVKPTSQINSNIDVTMQDFVVMPQGEGVEIKIDLEFKTEMSNNEALQVIEEINIDENRNDTRYSLIIYFVKQGDTLWNIAKRFKTTVDAIATMNGIEDENKIDIGEQLFIPNYCQ